MKNFLLSVSVTMLAATALQAQNAAFTGQKVNLDGVDHQLAPAATQRAQAPASRADGDVQSLDFTLAFQPYTALNLDVNVGTEVYQAFQFSATNCELYAGKTITSVNITTGCYGNTQLNAIENVNIFLSEDLDKVPFRSQSGKLGTSAWTTYKIELDEPYVIEKDKPFFIGYSCKPSSKNDYYMVVDGMARQSADGGYYGVLQNGKVIWDNSANIYGNYCIGATIEGEGLPENGVNLFAVRTPSYAEPNVKFDFDIALTGAAINTANSVEVEYRIGEMDPVTVPITLDPGLAFNEFDAYGIANASCSEIGDNLPFVITVTKVNGVENVSTQKTISGVLACFNKNDGFTRRFVVEEGTGTWCGWCPAGIVMMDYLKEKYPEEFIRIAVHGNDKMAVTSANPILNYFSGFPTALINRAEEVSPTQNGLLEYLDLYYSAYSVIPAVVEIDSLGVTISEDNIINIPTSVKFAIDLNNNNRYRLSYYITEDNLGPYDQSNNYAGGAQGEMGGWENEPTQVPTMYNEVVRRLVGGTAGITNSIPKVITGGESYHYDGIASLAEVSGEDYFVTAMVIDNLNGEIINAKQIKANKTSGVSQIAAPSSALRISAAEGGIRFNGEYTSASIYNVAGQLVATATGETIVNVPAGLYIVKADSTTAKVAVK